MSETLNKLAGELADDCMALMEATGEDRLFMEVSTVLGASSQTLEEAFLTEVRVRMAGKKARAFLRQKAQAWKDTQGSA